MQFIPVGLTASFTHSVRDVFALVDSSRQMQAAPLLSIMHSFFLFLFSFFFYFLFQKMDIFTTEILKT